VASEINVPSLIDKAPILSVKNDLDSVQEQFYKEQFVSLGLKVEELKSELDKEKQQDRCEKIRADLMKPYANKVFGFLIGYCVCIGVFLLMQGTKYHGFELPETVLAIIAGSTAVSAIGLVGFVVNGLFSGANNSRSTNNC
jgi:hypothetical protein